MVFLPAVLVLTKRCCRTNFPLRSKFATERGVRRRNLHMRILVALALTAAHGILVSLAGRLPESVAAVLAGTVYAPLWLASYLSLPVFGQAPSGGWPGPSILGWAFLAFTWFGAWLLAVSALKGLRP